MVETLNALLANSAVFGFVTPEDKTYNVMKYFSLQFIFSNLFIPNYIKKLQHNFLKFSELQGATWKWKTNAYIFLLQIQHRTFFFFFFLLDLSQINRSRCQLEHLSLCLYSLVATLPVASAGSEPVNKTMPDIKAAFIALPNYTHVKDNTDVLTQTNMTHNRNIIHWTECTYITRFRSLLSNTIFIS